MNPVHGTLLAFAAFGVMSWDDGIIKAVGGRMSVFEIGVSFLLASGLGMRHPWPHPGAGADRLRRRSFGVIAFTTIPFAEAYALIFMAPFIVMLLSIVLLKERIGRLGWAAIAGGLIGVLLVIKPGFRTVELGHLSALCAAVFVASIVIILRRLAGEEKRTSILGIPPLYALVVNAVLAGPGFSMPAIADIALVATAGLLGALGQLLLLRASRHALASAVGQAQHSQLIWAVLIGAIFYREFPDLFAITGLGVIAAAGLATIAASRFSKAPNI